MALGPNKVAVSSPGKVLVAGGYLVLDPKQIGLVIALSARIYAIVERDNFPSQISVITVCSPQFTESEWRYQVTTSSPPNEIEIKDLTPESPNHYIRLALSYALAYLSLDSVPSAKITIYADNDYYSQTSSPTYEHLKSLPRFNSLNTPITKANKTGLGSSAALITSITAAIIASYSDLDITNDEAKRIIHNLAQTSHCAAQGKVGSGFDVAAAVYGSCVYRRFVPEILENLWSDPDWTQNSERFDGSCRDLLRRTVNSIWVMEVTPFRLPSGLRVVMGDVAEGSATPGMVKSVLKWKASGSAAMQVWSALGCSNRDLIQTFNQIKDASKSDIVDGVKRISGGSEPSSEVQKALSKISKIFHIIRRQLRIMGDAASVPIEPESQTVLLEESLKIEGVLLAGVPGAGGYDAICCMIADNGEDENSTFGRLLQVWEKQKIRVCPLLAREGNSGIRIEDVEAFMA